MAGEDVWLSGGVAAPPSLFTKPADPAILSRLPKEAREHVLRLSLERVGITIDMANLGATIIPVSPTMVVVGSHLGNPS